MSDVEQRLRSVIADLVREELGRIAAPTPDEYLSTSDAARFAAVSHGTIRRWIKNGRLRDHRAGRLVRVKRADLERLLQAGPARNDSLTPEQRVRQKYG